MMYFHFNVPALGRWHRSDTAAHRTGDYVYLTLPKDATEQDVKDQVEELARMIQGTKHEIKRSASAPLL